MFRPHVTAERSPDLRSGASIDRPVAPFHRTVTVFYATNRRWNGDRSARAAYYGNRPTAMSYGTCQVSIPREHLPGERETPFIASVPFLARYTYLLEDPDRHVMVLDVGRLATDTFFSHVSQRIAASPEQSAFVYVHGYNVSFRDACRQTAQVAWDVGFQGAPMLFSWPSDGAVGNYAADEEEIRDAVDDLERFLWRVAKETGVKRLHVVAHSLGSRGLLDALKRMAEMRPPGKVFDQVVMAAADVRVHSFERTRGALSALANGATLYISDSDRALQFSQRLHVGHPRVGEVGHPQLLFAGIDTIDASPVSFGWLGINHSYWSDKPQVLQDLASLFRRQPLPRPNLQRREGAGGSYWVLGVATPSR